jgi:hypothetical protein
LELSTIKIEPTSPESPILKGNSQGLPSGLANRVFAPGLLTSVNDLSGYVGFVASLRPDSGGCEYHESGPAKTEFSPTDFIKPGAPLTTEPVTQKWMDLVADSSFAVNLNVLALSGKFLAGKKLELSINDLAKQAVPRDRIDVSALTALAQQPLPAGLCARKFVRAAYLTSVRYRFYNRVDAKASLTGLTLVGGDGALYRTLETFTENFVLAIDLRPLSELASAATPAQVATVLTDTLRHVEASPKIERLRLVLTTLDDDKDDDSRLSVSIVSNTTGASFGSFSPQGKMRLAEGQQLEINVDVHDLTVDQLGNSALAICIAPVGNDTW